MQPRGPAGIPPPSLCLQRGLWPDRALSPCSPRRAARCQSRLLPDGALLAIMPLAQRWPPRRTPRDHRSRSPASRVRGGRRRPHALFRKPWLGVRLQHLRASPCRGDGAGAGATITFVPHLVPLDRGILETDLPEGRAWHDRGQLNDALQAACKATVRAAHRRGAARDRARRVDQFLRYRLEARRGWRRLVLVACLDNLVKGAAGQALQNFNAAFGIDERTALL